MKAVYLKLSLKVLNLLFQYHRLELKYLLQDLQDEGLHAEEYNTVIKIQK